MRKVFLDDLPRMNGYNGKRIDWKKSVGCEVKFIYDGIEGEIKIINSKKDKKWFIFVLYDHEEFKINANDFSKAGISRIIGKRSKNFKIKIGQRFEDSKRDIVVIDREYRERINRKSEKGKIYTQKTKWYKYRCNKCGWSDGWMEETNLINNGCAFCANKVIVEGVNDIPTTHPWMVKYFQGGYDEAKKYTYQSNRKINVICPDCGRISDRKIPICNLYNQGFSCICSDGFSFGHKFVYNMLLQLEKDFNPNVRFDWCVFEDLNKKGRFGEYDFVLEEYKIIIEVDGDFHRNDNLMNGQTKEYSKHVDDMKDKLANKNGYEVIRIKYYDEKKEEFRDSIKNSKLSYKFNLNNIIWEECFEFALSNISKIVADYWNNRQEGETTMDLEKKFGICSDTIRQYLKGWAKVGYCNYDSREESMNKYLKASKSNVERCSKSVSIYNNGVLMGTYRSINELERKSHGDLGCHLQRANICKVLKGKRPHHKGFTFKYVE